MRPGIHYCSLSRSKHSKLVGSRRPTTALRNQKLGGVIKRAGEQQQASRGPWGTKIFNCFGNRIGWLSEITARAAQNFQIDVKQHIVGNSLLHNPRLERSTVGPVQNVVQQVSAVGARRNQHTALGQLAQERDQSDSGPIVARKSAPQRHCLGLENVLQSQAAGTHHLQLDVQPPVLHQRADVVKCQGLFLVNQSLQLLMLLGGLDLSQLEADSSKSRLSGLVRCALGGIRCSGSLERLLVFLGLCVCRLCKVSAGALLKFLELCFKLRDGPILLCQKSLFLRQQRGSSMKRQGFLRQLCSRGLVFLLLFAQLLRQLCLRCLMAGLFHVESILLLTQKCPDLCECLSLLCQLLVSILVCSLCSLKGFLLLGEVFLVLLFLLLGQFFGFFASSLCLLKSFPILAKLFLELLLLRLKLLLRFLKMESVCKRLCLKRVYLVCEGLTDSRRWGRQHPQLRAT
eukprot:m.170414 g.170414  ORF g.170414 m.170414 type:complete len:458 (+) comp53252_c0_seq1:101-1474(+)